VIVHTSLEDNSDALELMLIGRSFPIEFDPKNMKMRKKTDKALHVQGKMRSRRV
jgi:hypothetical protein